ncbi:hypothetical protein NQ317_014743 [Molorchus minor]|uniref:Uncharacterized protein n=1 Tax=Molorchus minor TaxID=1323400 RepID=A0ABQ9J4V6_9CUCU|nr:hypothetical protein NQ317_014743 [Molorchus minor]
MHTLPILTLVFLQTALCDDIPMQPVYKYRYETEDVMKTAETAIPVRGYHVVEGGYYPMEAGGYGGGKYTQSAPFNTGKFGGVAPISYGPGIGGGGIGFGGYENIGRLRGRRDEKEVFNGGNKNVEDDRYEKAYGQNGAEVNRGQEGFSKGQVAVKDVKGDAGYYNNEEGGKKIYHDGKQYEGGQHFDKQVMVNDGQ